VGRDCFFDRGIGKEKPNRTGGRAASGRKGEESSVCEEGDVWFLGRISKDLSPRNALLGRKSLGGGKEGGDEGGKEGFEIRDAYMEN